MFWLPGSAFLSAGPAGAWSSVCPLSGEFDGAVSGVVLDEVDGHDHRESHSRSPYQGPYGSIVHISLRFRLLSVVKLMNLASLFLLLLGG